jgi:ketosteroid isomerase-like protein
MSDERQIQEVLARYVRATDQRDGKAQGALFTDDAVVRILTKNIDGSYMALGEPLVGGAAVRYAVENYMAPHPEGGSSHHVTSDHIIEIDGDSAHLNAQFIVFRIRRADRHAESDQPRGNLVAQGSVEPVESGYYDTHLRRLDGRWKIVRHDVLMDVPMAALEA